MADTVFPILLTRKPLVSALTESPAKAVVRSDMDAGPAIVRRRFTGENPTFAVELQLTRLDLALFHEFYTVTTKAGSLSFEWIHPRTGAVADFRFLEGPQYRPLAPRGTGSEWWVASFPVEILPGVDVDIDPPTDDPPAGGVAGGTAGEMAIVLAAIEGDDEYPVEFAFIHPAIFEAPAAEPDFVHPLPYGASPMDYYDEAFDEEIAYGPAMAVYEVKTDTGGISELPGEDFPGGSTTIGLPWKPWFNFPTS